VSDGLQGTWNKFAVVYLKALHQHDGETEENHENVRNGN
jgi:hypothetical protein